MSAASGRAVSPVVGVVLLLVITLLLAGTVGAFALGIDMNEGTADGLMAGEAPTSTDTPDDTATPEPTPDTVQDDLVVAENSTAGAEGVVHSTVIEVGSDVGGEPLEKITVKYPKEDVYLSLSKHAEVITIGIDRNGDGNLQTTFDENDISGIGTNDDNSELTVNFDLDEELESDDRVQIRYEGAENPDSEGEYDVTVTLNDALAVDGSLVIE